MFKQPDYRPKHDVRIVRVFRDHGRSTVRFDLERVSSGDRLVLDVPLGKCHSLLMGFLGKYTSEAGQQKIFERYNALPKFAKSQRSDSDALAECVRSWGFDFELHYIQVFCETNEYKQIPPIAFAGEWREQFLIALHLVQDSASSVVEGLEPAKSEMHPQS